MDVVVFFTAFGYTCFAYGFMFLACELAQRSSDYFANIEDMAVQWNWYLFPDEIQRLLPLILIVMQRPVEIECFGGIASNRELYKKVRIQPIMTIDYLFDDNNNKNENISGGQQKLFLFHDAPPI